MTNVQKRNATKEDAAVAVSGNVPQSSSCHSDVDLLDTCVVYDSLPPTTARTATVTASAVVSESNSDNNNDNGNNVTKRTPTCGHVLQLSALVRYLHIPFSVYATTATPASSAEPATTTTTTTTTTTSRRDARIENPNTESTTASVTTAASTRNNFSQINTPKNTCPLCPRPILFICDQLCAVATIANNDETEFDSTKDAASSNNESPPIITFKFGKQTYRLTVALQRSEGEPTISTSFYGGMMSHLWKFGLLQQWRSFPPKDNPNQTPVATAQDRIARALRLKPDTLKILHKGKVLYPDPHLSAAAISTKLIEMSSDDWKRNHKASLVVMGTVLDERKVTEQDLSSKRTQQQRLGRFDFFLSPLHVVRIGLDVATVIWVTSWQAAKRLILLCYQFATWRPFLTTGAGGHPRQD